MAATFILGEKPLHLDSVNLGRLLVNISDPRDYYYDSPKASSMKKEITEYRDFKGIDELDKGRNYGLKMTKLVSVSRSKRRGRTHHYETKCVRHYLFNNYRKYFLDMIELTDAKKWIETAIKEGESISYLVGFVTFENAVVSECDTDFKSTDFNLTVPTTEILFTGLLGGIPAPVAGDVLDGSVSLGGDRRGAIVSQYTVPGEQVFALEYRRVKIGFLNSRDVKLPKGPTQWHLLTRHRVAHTVDTNDIVVADVNESEERDQFEFDDDDDDDETGRWTKVVTEEGDLYL